MTVGELMVDAMVHDPVEWAAFEGERAAGDEKIFEQAWDFVSAMREQAMVANADPEIDAYEVEDRCDGEGFPAEEEERGDGSDVKDDQKEKGDRVECVALCFAA